MVSSSMTSDQVRLLHALVEFQQHVEAGVDQLMRNMMELEDDGELVVRESCIIRRTANAFVDGLSSRLMMMQQQQQQHSNKDRNDDDEAGDDGEDEYEVPIPTSLSQDIEAARAMTMGNGASSSAGAVGGGTTNHCDELATQLQYMWQSRMRRSTLDTGVEGDAPPPGDNDDDDELMVDDHHGNTRHDFRRGSSSGTTFVTAPTWDVPVTRRLFRRQRSTSESIEEPRVVRFDLNRMARSSSPSSPTNVRQPRDIMESQPISIEEEDTDEGHRLSLEDPVAGPIHDDPSNVMPSMLTSSSPPLHDEMHRQNSDATQGTLSTVDDDDDDDDDDDADDDEGSSDEDDDDQKYKRCGDIEAWLQSEIQRRLHDYQYRSERQQQHSSLRRRLRHLLTGIRRSNDGNDDDDDDNNATHNNNNKLWLNLEDLTTAFGGGCETTASAVVSRDDFISDVLQSFFVLSSEEQQALTLHHLSLSGSRLERSIPRGLTLHLPSLLKLNLSQCNLSNLLGTDEEEDGGVIQSVWNLPLLTVLNLSHNRLRTFPGSLLNKKQHLPCLRELDLYGNHLSELESLMISDDDDDDDDGNRNNAAIHNDTLQSLNVGYNNLTSLPDNLTQHFTALKTLIVLNNFIEVIPESIVCGTSSSSYCLQQLDVSSNPIHTPDQRSCQLGLAAMRRYYQCLQAEEEKALEEQMMHAAMAESLDHIPPSIPSRGPIRLSSSDGAAIPSGSDQRPSSLGLGRLFRGGGGRRRGRLISRSASVSSSTLAATASMSLLHDSFMGCNAEAQEFQGQIRRSSHSSKAFLVPDTWNPSTTTTASWEVPVPPNDAHLVAITAAATLQNSNSSSSSSGCNNACRYSCSQKTPATAQGTTTPVGPINQEHHHNNNNNNKKKTKDYDELHELEEEQPYFLLEKLPAPPRQRSE